MTYFFILGRIPELSITEILKVFEAKKIYYSNLKVSPQILMLDIDHDCQINFLDNLGGSIKVGRIFEEKSISFLSNLKEITNSIQQNYTDKNERITFGFSAYNLTQNNKTSNLTKQLNNAGIKVKKNLKELGYSARFVAIQDEKPTLSSVTASKNYLADKGLELNFLIDQDKIYLGKTIWIQNFEKYSQRDYHKPDRDMKNIGLMPPKLAQIMINLSSQNPENNPTILDPFCGSGTILQEALLMGYKKIIGSDVHQDSLDAAKKNLEWLESLTLAKSEWKNNIQLLCCDAINISNKLKPDSIEAIITEPYLGPIGIKKQESEIKNTVQELSDLYLKSFIEFKKILTPNGVVVMIWPFWQLKTEKKFLPIYDEVLDLGYKNKTTIPDLGNSCGNINRQRGSILYSRPDQTVGREIFVFVKE